jgi:hypothetical protein
MVYSVKLSLDQREIGSVIAVSTKMSDTKALFAISVVLKSRGLLFVVNGLAILN